MNSEHLPARGRLALRALRRAVFLVTFGAAMLVTPSAAFSVDAFSADVLGDRDARSGTVQPTAAQKQMVSTMGATATWNDFGTPASLIKHGGFLATGLSGPDADTVARHWISANKALYRLSSTDGLRLVNASRLPHSDGYAVHFVQRFGGLNAGQDGKITIGVVGTAAGGWKVAYASSALTGDTALSGKVNLSAREAWLTAASDVGRQVTMFDVRTAKADRDWTIFGVSGFTEVQRARLVALPTPANGVRPAYETLVLDNQGGETTGYTHFIDAETGMVLVRRNLVQHSHPPVASFTGTMPQVTDGECDVDKGPWIVSSGESVSSVAATVFATLTTNDAVIHIVRDNVIVASQDTLFSPEGVVYDPPDNGEGTYEVRVCDFADGATWETPATYQGQVVFAPVAPVSGVPYPPKWKVFPAYPTPPTVVGFPWNVPSTDIRKVWCWDSVVQGTPIPGCQDEVKNTASRVPWDYNVFTSTPTFTTFGNNANTAESWSSPLTPGVFAFHPVSPTRDYSYPWTNEWYNHPVVGGPSNNNDCVSTFTPGVSTDISAAVTNLFAMHNRMHDWSYHLGFTEENWNAQNHNFGNGGAELDALEGDAQAGAATGGYPAFTGRNNANMVPTPDGVPPITNMYLWQPWKGAIYDPCVDGDYDMTVIGHEYTHLIENRMIGKGGGRSGTHAGNMGESFSDLNGIEVLREYSFVPVSNENPFAVGAYVTGSKQRGIRNYGMNFPRTGAFPTPGVSPLTNPFAFGDLGYDASSTSPHADGEIWSAVNHDIRQALVSKYNAAYPESNALLQRQCAEGKRTPDTCPGNRRWIQIMYDAFLLMPVSPTMLQARDAYLAADMMRASPSVSVNWPSNQNELWLAFARRGFGQFASSSTGMPLSTSDTDPKPDFASPNHGEATVTFRAVASNESNAAVNARVFVGHYEARVSPIAVTGTAASGNPSPDTNNLDNRALFVPGTYEFVAQAKGYGHVRFTRTFTAGSSTTVTINMPTNYASSTKGGVATPGPGTQARPTHLNDDTEATNWEATGAPVNGRYITVDLAGTSPRTVNRVQVSALNIQGQNRFTMLRSFKIQTSTNGTTFSDWITSPANAFPGNVIRPLVPDMILRSFSGPSRQATHVRLVVLTNQCTGQTRFQGVQDSDPLNATDCRTAMEPLPDPPGSFGSQDRSVRAAELQVFSSAGGAGNGDGNGEPPPPPPPGDECDIDDDIVKLGPPVASPGSNVEYTITYTNVGDTDDDDCEIDDLLGDDLTYVSSTGGGTYDAATGSVTWNTGKVAAGASRSFTLTAKVSEDATIGSVLINRAYFGSLGLDVSPLGTATTLVVS